MITLYGLKKCSTCVKACAWLDSQAIIYEFIDYRDRPISPDLLMTWSTQLGGWEKLVNRASMTWRNLSDADKLLTQDDTHLHDLGNNSAKQQAHQQTHNPTHPPTEHSTHALNSTQPPTQYTKHDLVWVDLIARYPTLIRRPLTVWHNQSVTAGFNEKKFLAEINKQ
jgi:arsenate reductase-like glutaredoxin family protein